jgi:beta-glucanase (GH16 family)
MITSYSIKKISVIFIIAFILTIGFSASIQAQIWRLVWADEFDSTSVNTNRWTFQNGTSDYQGPEFWGNNEKEYYRAENAVVNGGYLSIIAKKEAYGGMNYTSSRMYSKGKGDFKYGKIEARIKASVGQGLWHAFWMLPTDLVYGTWPKSGEIDILECFGQTPNMVQSTLHFGDFWPNNKYIYKQGTFDYASDFNVYTIIWEPNKISFFVGGSFLVSYNPASLGADNWPYNQRFHIILNLAVGGNLTNNTINDAILPGAMVVDYVRVYQDQTLGIAEIAALENEMSVAPNPFNKSLKIKLNEQGAGAAIIRITDITGREVYMETAHNMDQDIKLEGLSDGIYFLMVTSQNQSYTKKIIKKS